MEGEPGPPQGSESAADDDSSRANVFLASSVMIALVLAVALVFLPSGVLTVLQDVMSESQLRAAAHSEPAFGADAHSAPDLPPEWQAEEALRRLAEKQRVAGQDVWRDDSSFAPEGEVRTATPSERTCRRVMFAVVVLSGQREGNPF